MNISICITTFNEEESIGRLMDSLLLQSKKPNEIVIVDGGSKDKTLEIIRHYQKKNKIIKLLKEVCTRAKGRNLSIEIARNEIVAITDAGCIADKDWLKEICEPFIHKEIDISAGFYKMVGENPMQNAMGIFLGVTPKRFNANFLPSTRSIAFRKSAWEAVGGFPEGCENSAEDTDFNYKALKIGLKYARVKTAIVEWGMPSSMTEFGKKIFDYAKWDAQYGIWWHPNKRLTSHNIHSIIIILRYLLALAFLVFCLFHPPLFVYRILCVAIWFIGLLVYLSWSFRKVQFEFGDLATSIWGPVLQITSDIAVMCGFISGMTAKS